MFDINLEKHKFLGALIFFTIIRVPKSWYNEKLLNVGQNNSLRYFPLIGVIVSVLIYFILII